MNIIEILLNLTLNNNQYKNKGRGPNGTSKFYTDIDISFIFV